MAKQSDYATLIARLKKTAIVLKLARVYEFARDENGIELLQEDPVVPHSWLSDQIAGVARDGFAVALAKKGNIKLDLPTGVTVVMGMSGTGMTRLTRDIIAANNPTARYITYGEPVKQSFSRDYPEAEVAEFEPMFALAIATALLDDTVNVVIADSFRYLFYSAGSSSTGKGGVNMDLFTSMTYLDNVASALGKSIMVVINPLTDDPATFSFYEEAAMGSVSGVIRMKTPTEAVITTRLGRRDRRTIQLPTTTVYDRREREEDLIIEPLIRQEAQASVNKTLFGRDH